MTSTDTRTQTGVVRPRGYRPDIEGMRAVAILLVLVYHAGVPFLPGGFVGVDVFFVISGFLITGLLIRELETNRRISLSRFYARRARRLLPATALVLLVTTLLTWLSSSPVHWRSFGGDIVGSALYVVNWVLAGRAVDYQAEDVDVSPVQHFWSLAVEEQFYIVWPLLLVGVGWWVGPRGSAQLRPTMVAAILLVIVPSFLWSVHLTGANPDRAFFVTTTRLWELGIGAFVAIGASRWERLPRRVSIPLGWAGLVAVVLAGVLVDASTAWPGYAALLPTLGSAAVIVAGYTTGDAGPARLLSRRPAVWLGGLSYSLYLWHWPLLVCAGAQWGGLSPLEGTGVALLSLVPAYLSYRFVENPIRFSPALSGSNALSLSLGANLSALGAVAGLLLMLAVPSTPPTPGGTAAGAGAIPGSGAPSATPGGNADGEGATAGPDGEPRPGTVASLALVDGFVPSPTDAAADLPPGSERGCQVDQVSPEPIRCEYGDPEGEVTIAVVGDSKILQWQSPLDEIARERGWKVVSWTKSACGFHTGMQVDEGEPYTSCAEWNERVMDLVIELDPDVVLTTNRVNEVLADPDDIESRTTDAMVDALVEAWAELREHGIPVVGILDNPSPGMSVYECVAENPDDLAACTFDKDEGIASSSAPQYVEAAGRVPGTRLVDVRDAICPEDPCVPVIGGVLVYRQTSHLTDTYARTLRPVLEAELAPAVEAAVG